MWAWAGVDVGDQSRGLSWGRGGAMVRRFNSTDYSGGEAGAGMLVGAAVEVE